VAPKLLNRYYLLRSERKAMGVDKSFRIAAKEWWEMYSGRPNLTAGQEDAIGRFDKLESVNLRSHISDSEISLAFEGHPFVDFKGDRRRFLWMECVLEIVVYVRDEYHCVYCGDEAEQLDHLELRKDGGKWALDNLVATCAHCNRARGQKKLSKWLGYLENGEFADNLAARANAWKTHDEYISAKYERRAMGVKRRAKAGVFRNPPFDKWR
jgi:hypothetical protein